MGERKDGAGICIWWCRVGERKGGRERERGGGGRGRKRYIIPDGSSFHRPSCVMINEIGIIN